MKKRIENALFTVAFVTGCLGVLIASGVLLALGFAVAVKAQDGDRRDVRWATRDSARITRGTGAVRATATNVAASMFISTTSQSASGTTRRRESGTETTATASSSAGRCARP